MVMTFQGNGALGTSHYHCNDDYKCSNPMNEVMRKLWLIFNGL